MAGTELGAVIEIFVRRLDAEKAVQDVLDDEPSWRDYIRLLEIELIA